MVPECRRGSRCSQLDACCGAVVRNPLRYGGTPLLIWVPAGCKFDCQEGPVTYGDSISMKEALGCNGGSLARWRPRHVV